MHCELNEVESPEGGGEQASAVSTPGTSSSPQTSLPQSHLSTGSNNSSDGLRDNVPCLKYSLFPSVSDLLIPKQHVKTTKHKLQTCGPDFWLNVWLFFPHDLVCAYISM